jgi:hypothetical protein
MEGCGMKLSDQMDALGDGLQTATVTLRILAGQVRGLESELEALRAPYVQLSKSELKGPYEVKPGDMRPITPVPEPPFQVTKDELEDAHKLAVNGDERSFLERLNAVLAARRGACSALDATPTEYEVSLHRSMEKLRRAMNALVHHLHAGSEPSKTADAVAAELGASLADAAEYALREMERDGG